MIQEKKERNKKYMENKLQWVTSDEGVKFCIDSKHSTCVDMKVPKGIRTLSLSGFNMNFISMQNTKRSFPWVTMLFIGEDILRITIPNSLFPNVRSVLSASEYYLTGNTLQLRESKYSFSALQNSFCLHEDETLDLENVYRIDDYALEGCMTTDFINTDHVSRVSTHAFNHSAFDKMKAEKNGVLMAGNIMVAVDDAAEEVDVPVNTTAVNFSRVNFMKTKRMKLHCLNRLDDIGAQGLAKTVIFAKDAEWKNKWDFRTDLFEYTEAIEVERDNPDFKSIDGILYTSNSRMLIQCPGMKKDDVVIPDGVTGIRHHAFILSCIKSVKLPDSLKKIGHAAFLDCLCLNHIDFGHGITEIGGSTTAGNGYVFSGCKNLKKIVIPRQVNRIGYGAFEGSGLEEVIFSESIQNIESEAFSGCEYLKQIVIPTTDVVFGGRAMPSVKEIVVPQNKYGFIPMNLADAVTSFEDDAYSNIVKITNGDEFVYLQRYINWEDYMDLPKRKTIGDLKRFYLNHKLAILQNMMDKGMNKEFIEALSMSECTQKELTNFLNFTEMHHRITLSAAILELINKNSLKNNSQLYI